jgi:hypothetical protein
MNASATISIIYFAVVDLLTSAQQEVLSAVTRDQISLEETSPFKYKLKQGINRFIERSLTCLHKTKYETILESGE